MTTNPTEAWAIVGKDGLDNHTYFAWMGADGVARSTYLSEDVARENISDYWLSRGHTITPVLLIPRDEAVRWACQTLYQRFPDDHPAFNEMGSMIRDGWGAGDAFSAALRALAGEG